MSFGKGIMKTITGIRNEMEIGNEHVYNISNILRYGDT
jgi:hypothetical protein